MQFRELGRSGLRVSVLGLGLEENVGALDVKLTPEDLLNLNEVFPNGAAAGQLYPEHMMALVNA